MPVDDKAVKRLLARLEQAAEDIRLGAAEAPDVVREWAAAERKRAARRKEKR